MQLRSEKGFSDAINKVLRMEGVALLIIDVQNDFCPPNGSLAVRGGTEIIPHINHLRQSTKFPTVVLTQDWHPSNHISFASNNPGSSLFTLHSLPSGDLQIMWPNHCVQNSTGAEFHSDLLRIPEDIVVQKGTNYMVDSYSGFFDNEHKVQTDLHGILQQHKVHTVVLVGLAYDYCVGSTALDAAQLGYKTYLIKDLTRSVDDNSEKQMDGKLQEAGVNVVSVEQIGKLQSQ